LSCAWLASGLEKVAVRLAECAQGVALALLLLALGGFGFGHQRGGFGFGLGDLAGGFGFALALLAAAGRYPSR
jgi:hypothetical protein